MLYSLYIYYSFPLPGGWEWGRLGRWWGGGKGCWVYMYIIYMYAMHVYYARIVYISFEGCVLYAYIKHVYYTFFEGCILYCTVCMHICYNTV